LSNSLLTLAGMQKIDLVIKGMDDEASAYTKKIETLTARLEQINGGLVLIDNEIEALGASISEVALRITQANDRIRKNEERIRSVSGNKELKALNKETSTAGKIIRQAEKESSDLTVRQTEQGVLREARVLEVEEINAEIESLRGELEAKGAPWQEALKARKAERETLRAALDDGKYRLYENIRERRGGLAVVPLKKEACQGCYMHVPTQIYVQLCKGEEEIIRCPHCDRILYVEQTPAATEAP